MKEQVPTRAALRRRYRRASEEEREEQEAGERHNGWHFTRRHAARRMGEAV